MLTIIINAKKIMQFCSTLVSLNYEKNFNIIWRILIKFFLGHIFKELKIHYTATDFMGVFENHDQWGKASSNNNVVNLLDLLLNGFRESPTIVKLSAITCR